MKTLLLAAGYTLTLSTILVFATSMSAADMKAAELKSSGTLATSSDQMDGDCTPEVLYLDQDGDGFGVESVTVLECPPLAGYSQSAGDCDDGNSSVRPGATEQCNGLDDDCSGIVDDQVSNIPAIAWQNAFGGTADDALNAIDHAHDGGYILAGSSKSADGDVTTNKGGSDFWVVRIDAGGRIIWQKSYGGSADDIAYAVKSTPDGGYVVAGSTNSQSGDVVGKHGSTDAWVVKLDSSGIMLWQKCYGGSSTETAYDLDVALDNSIVFAGRAKSSNGDLTDNYGFSDFWVVKTDPTGNIQWQRNYGGSGEDFAHALQQTADGGLYVSGYARSNDFDVLVNKGQEDVWILKLNSFGDIVWQKSYGGTGGEGAGCLVQSTDGGCVTAGTTHSFNIDVMGNHGNEHDIWVVKTDSMGNKVWARCLGGNDTENGYSIVQAQDGGFVVVGRGGFASGDVSSNNGLRDYWMVKLNASGTIQWERSLGGSLDEEPSALLETSAGNLVVVGYSKSNNGDVTNNHGGSDFWIAELVPPAQSRFYRDDDGDGYGKSLPWVAACSAPEGYAAVSSDCDDDDANQNPGMNETCNGIDDDCNGQVDESGIQASITPLITTTICSISSITYSANAGPGFSYQWLVDGSPIEGATDSVYTASSGGMYSVQISDGACSSVSPEAVLHIARPIVELTPVGTTTICPGTSVTFTFEAQPGLTFQWYNLTGEIAGARSNNFSTADTGTYYVKIFDDYGCSYNSQVSSLKNYARPVTTIKASGDLNICSTGAVKLTVTAQTGSVYSWYKNEVKISGATKSSYTAKSAGSYKALVTSSNGCKEFTTAMEVTGCSLLREEFQSVAEPEISVYPNPSDGRFMLSAAFSASISFEATISIFNAAGHVVYTESSTLIGGLLEKQIALPSGTQPGIYLLTVSNAHEMVQRRLVITR